MDESPRKRGVHSTHIQHAAALLQHRYNDFRHHNKTNPLWELIFIVCSLTTTEPVYLRTFSALRRRFPTFSALMQAPTKEISSAIKEGGQYRQKAKVIKTALSKIHRRFGRLTLAPLASMPDEECETFLTSLPGVGKKVARCVMLYSLGRKTFPVDTHCWRIANRLGWIASTQSNKFPLAKEMDDLQELIPEDLRLNLHVNLISLGREFCRAKKPLCASCILRGVCTHAAGCLQLPLPSILF